MDADDDFILTTKGFADSPDMIQCRSCKRFKGRRALFFRRDRLTELGWMTVCRQCEKKSAYRETTPGHDRLLSRDANLPDALVPAMLEAHVETRKERRKLSAEAQQRKDFVDQWTLVRRVMAARRARLVGLVMASQTYARKHSNKGSDLYRAYTAGHGLVRGYIDALKGMYSMIIAQMRPMENWVDSFEDVPLRDRMPPSSWALTLAHVASGKALTLDMEVRVNPYYLAPAQVRKHVSACWDALQFHPDALADWDSALGARAGSRLAEQMFPWRYPQIRNEAQDVMPYTTGMPQWLIVRTDATVGEAARRAPLPQVVDVPENAGSSFYREITT